MRTSLPINHPPATRAVALAALEDFLPLVPSYAARRSYVTSGNATVSRLSPYLRRRLISEQEVVVRVLEAYPFTVAEKFIQEVVWRTYWKGWLERHPAVWFDCLANESSYRDPRLASYDQNLCSMAIRGETRLDFFNEWVHELLTTGYLHNHVRMWFASVWIFTLKLPWQLGAMFMYRHLLDGDPASNTLSWRWVAGLQTKGKSYLARADNIATYSEGRWRPIPGELAEVVCHIQEDPSHPGAQSLSVEYAEPPKKPYGIVTMNDDLSVECDVTLCKWARGVAVLGTQSTDDHQPCESSELVVAFDRLSEQDAVARLGTLGRYVDRADELAAWARAIGVENVVYVAPAVGPNREVARRAWQLLVGEGIGCSWYRRSWDAELHRLADKGFFPFWERTKKRIEAHDPLFYGKVSG